MGQPLDCDHGRFGTIQMQNRAQDPKPLPYLDDPKYGSYDINLTVELQVSAEDGLEKICDSNLKYMYWSMPQQLVHHSVTGCNMVAGDLLGSGTISGTQEHEFGSMLELCWAGKK